MDFVMRPVAIVREGRPTPEDWPLVGIFGQRGKKRPNRLGVSRCVVEGLDAIDGTPVLDIKPWMDEFGPRGDRHQPEWSHELMTDYYASS